MDAMVFDGAVGGAAGVRGLGGGVAVNGWGVTLLVIVVIGVGWGAGWAMWAGRRNGPDADPNLRRVRLVEIGVDGALFALLALCESGLGLGGVAGLGTFAITAGRLARMSMAMGLLGDPSGWVKPFTTAMATMCAIIVAAVSFVSMASRPGPTPAAAASKEFGVDVLDDAGYVKTQVLDHPPVLADAGLPGAAAVPVDRYRLAGQLLTVVVHHDLTCKFEEVLVGADAGRIDVIAVYTPSSMTRLVAPTDTPSASTVPDPPSASVPPVPSPPGTCRPGADTFFAGRTVMMVELPDGLTGTTVRDVGAHGDAIAVGMSPTP